MENQSSPILQASPPIQPQPTPNVSAERILSKKMNPLFIIFPVILLVGIGGAAGYYYFFKNQTSVSIPKACTAEAKICPDGSSVGRMGPNCEFAPCPSISNQILPSQTETKETSPSSSSILTSPSIPTQIPVMDDAAALTAMVQASEVARIGVDASTSTYTVSLIQGNYAKGMASVGGGGAVWFAAKVNGTWKLVFIGNGTVQCSDLISYPNFPNTMIPECWDAVNQKNVTR